jgi:hypothetical protein
MTRYRMRSPSSCRFHCPSMCDCRSVRRQLPSRAASAASRKHLWTSGETPSARTVTAMMKSVPGCRGGRARVAGFELIDNPFRQFTILGRQPEQKPFAGRQPVEIVGSLVSNRTKSAARHVKLLSPWEAPRTNSRERPDWQTAIVDAFRGAVDAALTPSLAAPRADSVSSGLTAPIPSASVR